jgi:hypothetical protein
MFSYTSGNVWLKHDIAAIAANQAFLTQDGLCINRILLRSSSGGYLLYDSVLKQFEFRNKDSFKVIFQTAGCV